MKKIVPSKIMEQAMLLWKLYSFEYRVILKEYNYCIDTKRKLGIKPLNKLSKFELRGFPYDLDEFLGQSCESDAVRHLAELDPGQIKKLIDKINDEYAENALVECLRVKIADSTRQIAEYNRQNVSFPIDPGSCTSGGHTAPNKALVKSRFSEA